MSLIGSSLSTEVIDFQSASPATLEVAVENLSDRFASFKVELTAAGADPNLDSRWYRLSPEVSTAMPPGDKTKFVVTILNNPIPGADLINVVVQVSSLEFPDLRRHNLRLRITPGIEPVLLRVDLPVTHLLTYPRQIVEVPVRVSNPTQQDADTTLKFIGLEPSWLDKGTARRLLVGAGRQGETNFSCQPAIAIRAPSGNYPFTIEAYLNNRPVGRAEGNLEVLPVGSVFYDCDPQTNWLPSKSSWLPQLRASATVFQLKLKNASNLYQDISLDVRGKKIKTQDYQLIPSQVRAKPGETIKLKLQITRPRHWLGLTKKLLIETTPILSDLRLGKTDPNSQLLELLVRPLLPVWLQSLLSLILIALSLWIFSLFQAQHHSNWVNSVSFGSEANIVLSASQDRTVRQWQVNLNHPLCKWFGWQQYCLRSRGVLIDAKTTQGQAVNVVKFRSQSDRTSNGEAIIGLEDGTVIRWDVNRNQQLDRIESQKVNRVLALGFTNNLKDIFIGRGTGIEHWDRQTETPVPILERYSIYELTLNQDETILISGGSRNKIIATDLNTIESQVLDLHTSSSPKDDRITGLAIAHNLLVTADNLGLIQTWDLPTCLASSQCEAISQTSKSSGIKAIALSQDGKYLVTADDRGQIELTPLQNDGLQSEQTKTIAQYDDVINAIDLITQGTKLLIISGGKDNRVRLHTHTISHASNK